MVLSDISTYCQVLGCLIKNPELRYKYDDINESDFDTRMTRMLFLVIKFLSKNNNIELTEFDIDSYIISNETLKNEYERNDGQAFLQQIISVANVDNFEYYYNRLKKLSLLRNLQKSHFDISYYYQENFASRRDEIECIDHFDNATLDDILDRVEGNFNIIKQDFIKGRLDGQSAGEGISELVEKLKKSPDFGVEMYGDIFSSVVRGARRGCLYLRSALTNVGKSLPNSTIIPTTRGYVAVGEIKEGDYLFDLYGKPTRVLKVFPQSAPQPIYKLFFSDGRICRSSKDHLWSYWESDLTNPKDLKTKTLEEIIKDSEGIKNGKYYIPFSAAINLTGLDLDDSRKLGFICGKYYAYDKKNNDIIKSNIMPDKEKLISIFNSSIESRRQFLLGVFSSKQKNIYKYQTNSYVFLMNLYGICNSLGIKTLVNARVKENYYELLITKKDFLSSYKSIQSCQLKRVINLDTYEDSTCFLVDNPLHLFVTENGMVTHNTRLAVFDLCKIVYPIKYESRVDENGEIIRAFYKEDRPPQRGLFIATENGADEIQTAVLAYLSGVNEDHILYGTYDFGEEARIKFAVKIMEYYKDYFLIEQITDPNLTNVQSLIKKYVTFNKVRYVFYDYLFTSPSLISQFSKNEIREETALELLTNQLKDLANQYNIFVMTATQLNGDALRWDTPKNQGCLKSSKAIATKPDLCMIISQVSNEELNLVEQTRILDHLPANYGSPTHVIDIYKYRRGRYKNVRIWTSIDLGTGDRQDLFVTDLSYRIIPIKMYTSNKPRVVCEYDDFIKEMSEVEQKKQKESETRMKKIEERIMEVKERKDINSTIVEDWSNMM